MAMEDQFAKLVEVQLAKLEDAKQQVVYKNIDSVIESVVSNVSEKFEMEELVSCECLGKKKKSNKRGHSSIDSDEEQEISPLEQNIPDPSAAMEQMVFKKPDCNCMPTRTEQTLNQIDANMWHNDMRIELAFSRDKLSTIDKLFGCEFLAGHNVLVQLCLLRDETIPVSERIIIAISAGCNQIHIPARVFFKRVISKVESAFSKGFTPGQEEHAEFNIAYGINGQCVKKLDGFWVILRKYAVSHVVDRVFLCGKTWCDINKSLPALKKCYALYLSYLIDNSANDYGQTKIVAGLLNENM